MKIITKITTMLITIFIVGSAYNVSAQSDQPDIYDVLSPKAASPWVENEYVRTRLVSSHLEVAYDKSVLQYLGWEIEMKIKGWKTYWRTPGEAGTPPIFNWDLSSNLAVAEVYYPRPDRFQIFGIQTFGYGERVVLPIRIEPLIGGAEMKVRMHAEFMSCKEICIPFTADYELTLPAPTGAIGAERNKSIYANDIRNFVSKVPLPNDHDKLSLNVASVSLKGVAGDQKISITLNGQRHLAGADVFIEAPKNFRFGAPQKQLQGDGKTMLIVFPVHTFGEDMDLSGQDITLTLHDGWGFARQISLNIQ